jgi:CxxC motif-containing protein (DUF1111 family)
MFGSNSFLMPAQNLSDENELRFYSGNSFFNQAWVEAPATTSARDGLGPLFNARSCSSCHPKDGKAEPPSSGAGPFIGVLFRLSIPSPDGYIDEPVYGGQLQDVANLGVVPEAIPTVEWNETAGTYPDGTPFSLIEPTYEFTELGYGPMDENVVISPRIGPHVIGLGLLEAITEERLKQLADPDDEDGDGISGRIQWIQTDSGPRIGRFGWKGDAPDLIHQVAGAFAGDMGLTSHVIPTDDCTDAQTECTDQPHGGEPEVDAGVFDRVTLYTRTVAVPARRKADDPNILHGKILFRDVGCDTCHTPSHTTGPAAIPELEGQLIWPYTDLLLHDMGEGLADHRPLGEASGREWKTPPLWGLGLVNAVNGHTRYLHDGRARSLEEAILWHGGEAKSSRDGFMALSSDERQTLLDYLGDL